MKTVKSFYASNFALSIFLDSEGILSGTFVIRGHRLVQHDFTGIYYDTGSQIELAFAIQWETVAPATSQSMFYGVIDHEEDTLVLNWMLEFCDDSKFPSEAFVPAEPVILTRDHDTTLYVRNVPFPDIKIKEAEDLQYLP